MRGGALASLAFALLLTVLGTINWIWTGDWIEVASFGLAVVLVVALALGLIAAAPEAARPGPPTPRGGPQAIVSASTGAVVLALGIASIAFGLAFGHFPVYFGAGLVVIGLGRLLVEWRAQRQALRAAATAPPEDRRPK